jgi:hypothetical protein
MLRFDRLQTFHGCVVKFLNKCCNTADRYSSTAAQQHSSTAAQQHSSISAYRHDGHKSMPSAPFFCDALLSLVGLLVYDFIYRQTASSLFSEGY